MTKEKYNTHVIYGIILIVIVAGFLFLGNYYVSELRAEYGSQIGVLNENISELQDSVDELSSGLEEINKNIIETNKQYEMQIGSLSQRVGDLVVDSESFSSVISEVIDSVVSVLTDVGQGSGAIISSEGYVITNYHVIQGARRASIVDYDGNTYGVRLIGYNRVEDLAVLQIVSNTSFDYFDFGDSDNLKAGQKVVALGNPAGLSFTATEGIISSPSRLIDGKYFIQTDVTINPGNSGGPLINSQGEIIGIAEFKISGYEGLGFAIPSDRVESVVDDLI